MFKSSFPPRATIAKIISAAIASASLVSIASARTDPGFYFDLRVHGTGAKSATVSAPGDVLTLDLYCTVIGANENTTDDGIADVFSNFVSSNGGLLGDLLGLSPPAPFNLSSSTGGVQNDLDGDGDFDVGTNDINNVGNQSYFSRAGGASVPTPSTGILIASVRFTAVQLAAAQTQVNWQRVPATTGFTLFGSLDGRTASDAAAEQGVGIIHLGAPVTINAAQVQSGGTTEFLTGTIGSKLVVDHTIRQGNGSALVLDNGIDVHAGGLFDSRDSAGHYTTQQIRISDAASNNSGGAVFSNSMKIGQTAPGTYTQSTGLTQIGSDITLGAASGNAGTLVVAGGSLRCATLSIGSAADGFVSQTGGFTTAARLKMMPASGINGTLDVGGGVLTAGSGTIGGGGGTAVVCIHDNGQLATNGFLYLNAVGANHGSLLLQGGTLSGTNLSVIGGATFEQSGGTTSLASMGLGVANGSNTAFYRLDGGVALLGGALIGDRSPATLRQSGGSLSCTGNFYVDDLYDLRDGQAHLHNLWIESHNGVNQALMLQTGGLMIADQMTVFGTYRITGGELQLNGDVDIEPGGTIDFANSPAAFHAGANSLVHLPVNALNNTANASLTGAKDSLINYPAGYNPAAHFANVSSQGLLHEDGTALNIPHDQSITGSGAVSGAVTNHGTLHAVSELDVSGSFTQAVDGTMIFDIQNTEDGPLADVLDVDGPLSLAGSLKFELLNGFVPSHDDEFQIIGAASITGTFANTPSQITIGNGRFDVIYGSTSVSLTNFTTVPEPSLIGATIATALFARRRRAPR